MNESIRTRNPAHTYPIGIAKSRVNPHGVAGFGVVHYHGEAVFGNNFDAGGEGLTVGIRHVQSLVGEFATRVFENEIGSGWSGFRLRAIHREFYAERACADGFIVHEEILTHAIHTDGIFLHQPGPDKTGEHGSGFNLANGGKRQTCSASNAVSHDTEGNTQSLCGGRLQPQPLGGDVAAQLLEITSQIRPAGGRRDGEAVAVVILARLGSELVKRNGLGGFSGNQASMRHGHEHRNDSK